MADDIDCDICFSCQDSVSFFLIYFIKGFPTLSASKFTVAIFYLDNNSLGLHYCFSETL